ncbi:MAG: amidohydrolase family protein, partial [Rhodospirillaceae bacterium]|nr:amidohydrolase family protein [Rhodospirillaceae bacterium]
YHPWYAIRAYTRGKVCADVVDYAPDEVTTWEAALIAHTRSNAYILFMEDEAGTLAGEFVDRVVPDRDCLTIPADAIRDIRPVMTLPAVEIGYAAAD